MSKTLFNIRLPDVLSPEEREDFNALKAAIENPHDLLEVIEDSWPALYSEMEEAVKSAAKDTPAGGTVTDAVKTHKYKLCIERDMPCPQHPVAKTMFHCGECSGDFGDKTHKQDYGYSAEIVDEDVCEDCGISSTKTKLIWVVGSKQVPEGTTNARRECMVVSECRNRKPRTYTHQYAGTGGGVTHHYSQTTYVQKCRHAPTHAFSIGPIQYYGGSESKIELSDLDDTWLVISLLGSTRDTILKSGRRTLIDALKPFTLAPDLVIDWPDMKAPPVKAGFWLKLYEQVKRQKTITKVLFYCIGGHGRTGTALSGTLVECSAMGAVPAVKFTRKHYCKEAVESESQLMYLKDIASIFAKTPVETEPEPEVKDGKSKK